VEASYSECTEIGRIGMPPRKVIETPPELPEHLKGYHPAKALPKKKTCFYGQVCHVRFDRKTFPKKGKSVLLNSFIDTKHGYWRIWDIETRALLKVCHDIPTEDSIKQIRKKIGEMNESTTRFAIPE